MVKLIALMRLREDIAVSEAQRMYEEEHAPLVVRLMPMIREYRRNYLDHCSAHIPASQVSPDFDMLTELWFDDAVSREAFLTRMREGDEGRQLRADSARFLRAGSTRMLLVEETVTVVELDEPKGGAS